MLSKQQIDEIIEPTIEGLGFEFVCSELVNTGNKKTGTVVRIYIDKTYDEVQIEAGAKNGVTLDDCTTVSQQVSRVLHVESEAQNSSIDNISLEVSSPGLDRPLVKLSHYKRFIGKKVKIKLNSPINTNQRNVVGLIKSVSDDGKIDLESVDSQEIIYKIDFDNINKANIVPQW